MRTIESATIFRKELKKLIRSPDQRNLVALLEEVLELLIRDKPLPIKNRDHPLAGTYKGYRDCHIKPDVILIYGKPNETTLWLARIGTHGELF